MLYGRTGTCAKHLFTASVLITPVCCYVIVGGVRSLTDKDSFFIGPLQTAKLLVRRYSWWKSRQWWADLPGHEGISDPKRRHGGARRDQGIWVIITNDSLASKKSRRRPEPPATVWIPSSEEDEGDKWGSFGECCSPATSLKAHLHLFHPHTELN